MKKNLIVGCGITGIVLANRIANELQQEVIIIDKRCHIGGNCYDYLKNGIYIHKYGAHIFHTNSELVWKYLSQFTDWQVYMHKVKALIDGIEIPIPFNLNSLKMVFPKTISNVIEKKLIDTFGFNKKVSILNLLKTKDSDLKFLADYVYNKVFLGYTLKQWGIKPEDLDNSVTDRVPIYISNDDRYFQDKFQGIPINGYTNMFKKMLRNKLIKVKLNTDFKKMKDINEFNKIYFTGSIDEFFNYKYGKLPYRSLRFENKLFNQDFYQSNAVINYPENYNFTRIIEHKYFSNKLTKNTFVTFEYPTEYLEGENEKYYPIINEKNIELFNKYLIESEQEKNTVFIGRLGEYKYYNMDIIVEKVLNVRI